MRSRRTPVAAPDVGHDLVAGQLEERQQAPHPLDRVEVVLVHVALIVDRTQFFFGATARLAPGYHSPRYDHRARHPPRSLSVGQLQAPRTKVLFERTILFPQLLDHIKLVAIHPARERNEENPQPDGINHGPSVLSWPSPLRVIARLNFRIVRRALLRLLFGVSGMIPPIFCSPSSRR
jgi:hypothetical protein